MFSWLNKQGVKSSKGFIVQRTGRFTAEYQEGSRKISVNLENGMLSNGKFCEIISSNAFLKWDDGSFIEKKKQDEILKNFIEAMEFKGIGVVIE